MAKQSRPPSFLLTRPAAQAARFAQMLQNHFGATRVILSPLMEIRFLTPVLPHRMVAGLIFTSENAVEGFVRLSAEPMLQGVRWAWCVGDRTAQAARDIGLQTQSAQGDAEALLSAIIAAKEPGPLLHLCGGETRGDLENRLNLAGIETFSAVVYRQEAQMLSPEAIDTLAENAPLIVPVFSPRTARILVRSCQEVPLKAPLYLAAMSPAVADELQSLPHRGLEVAAKPNAEAMLAVLERLIAAGRGA